MLRQLRSLSAALTALSLIAGCGGGPRLTLAARTSLRARHEGAALAQVWTASAALGWAASAAQRAVRGAARDLPPEVGPGGDPMAELERATPCAVLAACAWEVEQRAAALARLAVLESEEP